MAFSVNTMDESKMRRAFDLFDKDGDGKISQDELGDVLKTLNRSATDADIRELIGGSVSGMFTARGGAIDGSQAHAIARRGPFHGAKQTLRGSTGGDDLGGQHYHRLRSCTT